MYQPQIRMSCELSYRLVTLAALFTGQLFVAELPATMSQASQSQASQKPGLPGVGERTLQGSVVSAGGGKLVMAAQDGTESLLMVDKMATVMINNKLSRLEDLAKGDPITVTLDPEGNVLNIDCQRMANFVAP